MMREGKQQDDIMKYINSIRDLYPDNIIRHFPDDGFATWVFLNTCIAVANHSLFKFF